MDNILVTLTLIMFVFGPLVQLTIERFFVASIYIYGNVLVHELLFSGLDGLPYYWSAALMDLVTITLLSSVCFIDKLKWQVIIICMISMIINAGGWLVWFLGMEPMVYNLSFVMLNAYTIYLLISGDSEHGRLGAGGNGYPVIWSYLINSRKQSVGL